MNTETNLFDDNDTMVLNILATYADATIQEKRDGFAWYPLAYDFAKAISEAYPISVEQATAVIAATSPQKDWDTNKVWAAGIVDAFFGSGFSGPNSGYRNLGMTNSLNRAIKALEGDLSDIQREAGTMKVNRFYNCILGNPGYATIDRHAIRVALYDFLGTPPAISDGAYRKIERAYLDAAAELRKGVRHIQAVTWLVCRRERGLADDPKKFARQAAIRNDIRRREAMMRHPSNYNRIRNN